MEDQTEFDKHHLKEGDKLSDLQKRLNYLGRINANGKQLIGIVFDEYSMISSLQFFWASDRVQQGVSIFSYPFGGIPTIIFGDPGQLPPVGGSQLWSSTLSTGKALSPLAKSGYQLYKSIETVMWLTVVRRQEGFFRDYLLRLRDGTNTLEDWEILNSNCSSDSMSAQKINSFNDFDTTYLYCTNSECIAKNIGCLQSLQQPVVMLKALHDEPISARKSPDIARNLQAKLFCSLGSKIMLLHNLSLPPTGLVNGSIGLIIDFVYISSSAPELPDFIIIEFESYKGPPIFSGETRKKWVPLPPSKAEWYSGYGASRKTHYRIQYPISLAWALTSWKAQGMTCSGKVVAPFPEQEKQAGLSYVNQSRITKMENLNIGKAIPFDRLTTKITACKALKPRLIEDKRLLALWDSTIKFFGV